MYLSVAERLADGGRFPLGRYLLGSAYHLLHQVTEKLLLGEPIGNLGGPWWFSNMWLNVHMHKCLRFDFFAQQFPKDIAEDYELRIDKWILALSEFDLCYESAKAVKGQIMADFVTQHCGVVDALEIIPWMLFFDGSTCDRGEESV